MRWKIHWMVLIADNTLQKKDKWTWKHTNRNYRNETKKEQNTEKKQKISKPWDHLNERRGWETEKIFEEIVTKNFPNLIESINPQIQEPQRTPSIRNMNTPVNCWKPVIKRKIFKAERKRNIMYKGTKKRITEDFMSEIIQATR